jgi:ribosome-associated toxin RatA of RatAB toxin-antitoxin module
MTTLKNEISIEASRERIWTILADLAALHEYDPAVERSEVTSANPSGVGASRRVEMADGRHWFEESLVACEPSESLAFELTECNFPIKALSHRYGFESDGERTKVTQVMEYEVKYGLLGRALDRLVLRRQSDRGVKKFFDGLKRYAEQPE